MPAMPCVGNGEKANLVKNKLPNHIGVPVHKLSQEPGASDKNRKQEKNQDISKAQVKQRRCF